MRRAGRAFEKPLRSNQTMPPHRAVGLALTWRRECLEDELFGTKPLGPEEKLPGKRWRWMIRWLKLITRWRHITFSIAGTGNTPSGSQHAPWNSIQVSPKATTC